MKLPKRKRKDEPPPPIFADLLIKTPKRRALIDVEQPGWLTGAQPLLERATHLGLVTRKDRRVAVWLTVDGEATYFSKVYGTLDVQSGERGEQRRVACVGSLSADKAGGSVYAWLHSDGRVDVGPEPTGIWN